MENEQIKNIIIKLYQNREQEIYSEVMRIIECMQIEVQEQLKNGAEQNAVCVLNCLKELIEKYKNHDMIGMADVLTIYNSQ